MWRPSWRFLLQARRIGVLQPFSPDDTAHLGIWSLRLRSCNGRPPSCFSTAAEAASTPTSVGAEAVSSHTGAETVLTDDSSASCVPAISLNFEGEQGENALLKIIGEHRQLVSALRAELEEQKTITRSILDGVSALTKKANTKSVETEPSNKKIRWPEWTAFLELLQESGYLKDGQRAALSSGSSNISEELTNVKKAILKFSQAHGSIFQYLSPIDLRIVARYGCVATDSDAAASQRILCQHFHLDDVKLSEDSGYKTANIQPRLSDVTTLLYSCILEGPPEEDVILSIRYLLREIVSLSRKPSEAVPAVILSQSSVSTKETAMQGKSKESLRPERLPDESRNAKDSHTFPGGDSSHLGKGGAKQESKAPSAPQWKCPRCSFMNLDTKQRCVECSRRRPQRTYTDNSVKTSEDLSVVDVDTEEWVQKGSEKRQGRGNVQDLSSTSSDSEVEICGSDDAGKKAKTKNPFDVLDEILDSNEHDEDESSEEPPRGKGRGGSKKASSLSGLLSRPPKKDTERRNDSAMSGRRTFNGRSQLSRDPKRRISLSTNEDESSSSDAEMPSGKGYDELNDDDEDAGYARRTGKEKRSSGRGGNRRNRGDSYEERSNERGFRSTREFGVRERGSRSDSFGTREFGDRDMRSRPDNFGGKFSRARPR